MKSSHGSFRMSNTDLIRENGLMSSIYDHDNQTNMPPLREMMVNINE